LERFGKFQLLELIGRGGMAEVYLAKPTDVVFSKLIALKRIRPEYTDDPSFQNMFQQEGKIALSLRHHGVIAVHEMGVIQKQCYMSMEYFPGKTLSNIITQVSLSKSPNDMIMVAFIIMRVAEALNYIHDFRDYGGLREIIHRDISPHNIMVGFDGAIKLIDFGIAKDTSLDISKTKSIKGKIAYMSPEQVRGNPLTKRTDIFSLGVVFWEMLMLKKLFAGSTIGELTKKVEDCYIPTIDEVPNYIPRSLYKICQKALSENPQARFHTAGEMSVEIQKFLKNLGVEDHQKHLSEFVRNLFPDEFTNVKKLLRKYEDKSESSLDMSQDYPEQAVTKPAIDLNLNLNPFVKTSVFKTKVDYLRNNSHKATITAIAVAGILIGHIIISTLTSKMSSPDEVSVSAPMPTVVTKTAVPTPPALAPVPQLAPSVPQPVPIVSLTPSSAKPPLFEDKSKFKPRITKRKPASPITPPGFAYIMVLAEPNTQILVNGKYVGKEMTNEIKVPANHNITIQTISKANGATKSKTLNFKPSSRNVVEMFDTSN